MNNLDLLIPELSRAITGREKSFFSNDLQANFGEINSILRERKLLVFGASGFIANETIKACVQFNPRELVVIDVNENSLTELIRSLRNNFNPEDLPRITPVLADITNPRIHDLSKVHGDADMIWNFAAVKHVRSERDPLSMFRMFDVNVLGMRTVTSIANDIDGVDSIFSVSTDKAANPAGFMGASKRIMEQVLFTQTDKKTTSARFANVAFSAGSLLESWLKRIASSQPAPVPVDTKRYFVSPEEAGQLCLLAATLGRSAEVAVPTLDAENDLMYLEETLNRVLRVLGLSAVNFSDELEAIANAEVLAGNNSQAVLLTPRDTSGEKPFEEFVGIGESLVSNLNSLASVESPAPLPQKVSVALNELQSIRDSKSVADFQMFSDLVNELVPGFEHVRSGKSLDNRL